MGGRIAEEIVFKDPTTGASNDFEKATSIARTMVTKYGMSAKVGAISLGSGSSAPFLGRELATHTEYSNEMAQVVDNEVRAILETALDEAHKAITTNRAVLDKLAKALLEQETLNQDEIAKIFKTVKKVPTRSTWRSSAKRPIGTKGPIAVPVRKVKELEVLPETQAELEAEKPEENAG
jgi:cell division protease FtsH